MDDNQKLIAILQEAAKGLVSKDFGRKNPPPEPEDG